MYGYDISNWQKGMNVSGTLHDFGIFKATEGTSHVDPTFTGFMKQTSKYRGVYHYLKSTGNVSQEVDNFIRAVKPYLGRVMLAVDVEDPKLYNATGVERTRLFLNELKARTGVTGFVYTSLSWENKLNWGDIVNRYPLWVAQYNNNAARGYNAPALYGTLKHWKTWTIHQYTSHGHVSGYGGALDLNISKGDWYEWLTWCKASARAASKPVKTPQPATRSTAPKWANTTGRVMLIKPVKIRKAPSTSAATIAVLPAGSVVKYTGGIIQGGYRWIRQPRGKSFGYLATGPANATLAYVKG